MAGKYLEIGSNGLNEANAIDTTTGVSDASKIVKTDSTGHIAEALLPTGIGADVKVAVASEALSAGDLVNLWSDSGTLKARKADATAGIAKTADGFVKSAVSLGANATVYLDGTNANLTGLTVGAQYYLSSTAGGVTTTIPTTAGYGYQYVGKATATTELIFEAGEPILRV